MKKQETFQVDSEYNKIIKASHSSGLIFSVGIYLFKVKNGNTRTVREICPNITRKKQEWRHWGLSSAFFLTLNR